MPHVHVLVKIWCTMWSWSVVFLPSLVMFTLILEGLFCMMASCGIAVLFRTREHAQISRTGPCAQSRAVYIQQSATQSCWLSCSTAKTVCLFVCLTFFLFSCFICCTDVFLVQCIFSFALLLFRFNFLFVYKKNQLLVLKSYNVKSHTYSIRVQFYPTNR